MGDGEPQIEIGHQLPQSELVSKDGITVSRVRVIDLETAGNGPYDLCEIGWQDVVLVGTTWRLNEEGGSFLVNPGRPISAETMAIHHIIDVQVSGAPLWKEIAPEVLRPPGRGPCPGGAPRRIRAALLHAQAERGRALDLHMEVCATHLAASFELLQPDAQIPTDAPWFDP